MQCNKCGKTFQEHEDYAYIQKDWGYFSKKDLTRQKVRLCESCWDSIINSLEVPVEECEYNQFENLDKSKNTNKTAIYIALTKLFDITA